MYSSNTVHVQFMYSLCTVFVQFMYTSCTLQYSSCTIYVQFSTFHLQFMLNPVHSCRAFVRLVYMQVQLISTSKRLAAMFTVVDENPGKMDALNMVLRVRFLSAQFAAQFTLKLGLSRHFELINILHQHCSRIAWKNKSSIKNEIPYF